MPGARRETFRNAADWATYQDAELLDADGRLGRPVSSDWVRVPREVALSHDGAEIQWEFFDASGHFRADARPLQKDALDRFVRIESPKDVLRFAKRSGVFGFVELRATDPHLDCELEFDGLRIAAGDVPITSEPTSIWLYLARHARSILNIAASLKRGNKGRSIDWNYVQPDFSPVTDAIEDARFLIHNRINWWLQIGRVGLRIRPRDASWKQPGWLVEISFGGTFRLLGALAVQLLVTITGNALYTCTGCGYPYNRDAEKRRPKPDQNNYCDCCGNRQAKIDAKQRYNQREKAQRLSRSGVSIGVIADQLKTDLPTVETWLRRRQSHHGKTTRKR